MTTKRKQTAFLLGILLFGLYCGIFLFSGQDGDTSGGISMTITRQGVKLWDELTKANMSAGMQEELAALFEHPLRKSAHFAEYAVMGVLVYGLLYCIRQPEKKKYLWVVIWVLVSAALDEFHQYFVPGRWASISDVLLDTCGGAAGAALCVWIIQLKRKRACKKAT